MTLGKIGKYEKLDVLGHGASGIVYLAWDSMLGKHVALKEISLQTADEIRSIEEARVLDRLRHPNIVRVNGVDKVDGQLIIDMEYVRGTNLQKYMREHGILPVQLALSIAVQICSALEYAHKNHTIHRDVKPANILIDRDGTAKIADFGLAEILGSGSYAGGAGTYAYMAPEDFAEEERSDSRSDIWSVGVTLYEMLTGRRPFQAVKPKDPFSWKRAVEEDEPPPLSEVEPPLSRELEQVIAKALAKDKNDRYQSAGEMLSDLEEILESAGGPLYPDDVAEGCAHDLRETPRRALVESESPASEVVLKPGELDFGAVRKGEYGRLNLHINVPGRGWIEGRVASQPGWISVEPQGFRNRRQMLRIVADTESIWQPGRYTDRMILDIDGDLLPVPVTMRVIPPRREFWDVAWWYVPLFLLALLPFAANLYAGKTDTGTSGLIATGLLSLMVFIVSMVADLGAVERLLPAAIGAVGLGAIAGFLGRMFSGDGGIPASEILMTSVLAAPLCFLIGLQLLTASRWRFWALMTAAASACAALVLTGARLA